MTTELRVRGHFDSKSGGEGVLQSWNLRVESHIAAKEDSLVNLSTTAIFFYCTRGDVRSCSLTPAT